MFGTTNELEVKVETVNINTDTLEAKVQATNDALTTVSTVTNALLTSVKTAVEKIDDDIDGTEMQVDVKTMPTTAVPTFAYLSELVIWARVHPHEVRSRRGSIGYKSLPQRQQTHLRSSGWASCLT